LKHLTRTEERNLPDLPYEAVSVAAESSDSDADVYSADEEAGILERLRDLGYE